MLEMFHDWEYTVILKLKSNKLKHLTNNQVDELMNDYYNINDTNYRPKEIVEKYQLNVSPNQIYKLFPPVVCNINYFNCPYDGNKLLARFNSREKSWMEGWIAFDDGVCLKCGHTPLKDCHCKNCRARSKHFKQNQLNWIVNKENKIPALTIKELDVTDKLYLAALLKGFLSKNQKLIYGFDTRPTKDVLLSMSNHRMIQIYKRLADRGIINISPFSSLKAIRLDDDHKIKRYDLNLVNYDLNVKNPFQTKKELIDYLKYPSREEFLRKKKVCLKLWKRLASDDCKAYLNIMISKVLFDGIHLTNMTNKVINKLLEDLSQGQIFYLIYNAVIDGSTLNGDSNMTKKKIVNSIIAHIETEGNKAVQNNLKLPNYFWPEDIETSKIDEVFFDDILQIPKRGIEMVPTSNLK